MEWKTVAQDSRYEVSEFGDVRSSAMWVTERNTGRTYKKRERILSQWKNYKGYPHVQLSQKATPVHRIVSMAFLPNPNNLPEIDHLDGDKTNNHFTNLEWVSTKENLKRAYENGLRKIDGLNAYNRSIRRKVMRVEDGKVFESIRAAAKEMNGLNCASNIQRACTTGRVAWGFHWTYV